MDTTSLPLWLIIGLALASGVVAISCRAYPAEPRWARALRCAAMGGVILAAWMLLLFVGG